MLTNMIRILAVDDHPMFLEALAALLGSQPDMKVVAEAASGREAIQQFRTHQPDITLMDLQMPGMNGLDAMAAIRKEFSGARIMWGAIVAAARVSGCGEDCLPHVAKLRISGRRVGVGVGSARSFPKSQTSSVTPYFRGIS